MRLLRLIPSKKSVWWGKWLWKIFAFCLIKKELMPEGGEVNYPANWRVSWVNQETPALDISAIDYVIQGS